MGASAPQNEKEILCWSRSHLPDGTSTAHGLGPVRQTGPTGRTVIRLEQVPLGSIKASWSLGKNFSDLIGLSRQSTSGIRSQESGIRNQESGIRKQEA